MNWEAAIQVVNDPGQNVIRATVFDPFVGEALIRPTPSGGATVFHAGGDFAEDLTYDFAHFFTVAAINGTVSSEPIDLDREETIIPAALYDVPVKFEHPEMQGTLEITAPVNMVVPPARFYQRNFDVGWVKMIPDADHTLSGDAEAVFLGTRRNLTVMHIVQKGGDLLRGAMQAREFDRIRNFCAAGGDGWRLPGFSELGGILDNVDDLVGAFRHRPPARLPGAGGDPAQMFDLPYAYPALSSDNYDRGSAVGTDRVDGGYVSDYIVSSAAGESRLAVARNDQGDSVLTFGHDQDSNLDIICVREHNADTYQPPVDPAEIQIDDERPDADGALLFTIFAAPDLPLNADYQTVTLRSWRFDAVPGEVAPRAVPALDNPVKLQQVDSRLRVGSTPTDNGGIILRVRPNLAQDLQTSLVVFPQVGRTVTVSLSVLHPVFTFDGDPVYLPGDRVDAELSSGATIQLEYHGSRRGLHILYSATGGVGDNGVLPRDDSGGFNNLCVNSEEDTENLIRRFRPPTLGEIGGLLSDSAGALTATLQQAAPPSANLPAGWLNGLEISLGLAYASVRDAITLADPLQHFSRNALGRRSVIDVDGDDLRLRDPADFSGGARAVCVLPDEDVPSDALPALRGVRMETDARDDRGNRSQRVVYGDEEGPLPVAGGVPDLRATAISSTEDPFGTRIFRGTFQHWQHRDNPEVAAGLPRVSVGDEPHGYDVTVTNDSANHRALVEIFIGDPPPVSSARATLTILAASEFGQSVRAEIEVDNRPVPLDLFADLITREGISRDIHVAYGHFGAPPLTITPNEGYTLSSPSSLGGGLNLSEVGGTLFAAIASALTASRTERVNFTAECADKAQCTEVSSFQATLNLIPVRNPGQLFVSANEANVPGLDSGPLVPPVGFESGGTFYEAESEYAESLHTLYFNVDSDTGAITAQPGSTITSDIYGVPARFSHPDILGDLPMEVAVEVAPAGAVLFFVSGALKDASFAAVGATVSRNVAPLGEPALSAGAIVARYVGVRRGLQIVHMSPADGDDPLGAALSGGNFADVPAICDNLQFGWRMPTFLEALGIYHNSDTVGTTFDINFTKSPAVLLPGYTHADSGERFAASGVPARTISDDNPPDSGNILINLPVAEKSTGNPRLGSWEAPPPGGGDVNFSGSVDRRGIACVRPAVREYATPADIPAGISANGEPARDGKLVAYLIRPDNYSAGQPYGNVELRSHRYDAAGNVVDVSDPAFGFSAGEPNGAGVSHTLLAETPNARTYAFTPEDPDAPEALHITLALTPAVGAPLALEVNLLRQAELTPENALPVRQTAIAVAQGYVGRGYQLLPGPLYRLFGFAPGPETDFEENGRFLNLGPGDVSDPNDVFEASVEFTAECRYGVCPGAIVFGATVVFIPVSDPGQARVKADAADAGSLSGDPLRRPAGYESGGTFEENVPAYQTPEHAGFFVVDAGTGAIGVEAGQTPTIGTYAVPVLFSHPEFLGKVSIAVDVEVLPANAIAPFGTTYFENNKKTLAISGVNDNHGLDLSGVDSIDAVYEEIWRDLEIVRVTVSGAGDVALNDLDSATGAEFAAIRAFCRDRGHGWRMLTFAEALGIADEFPGNSASFVPAAGLTIPGFEGATVALSDLPDGSDVSRLFGMNVLADFIVLDNGRPAVAAFSDGDPTEAHGGRRSRSGLFCARPNTGAYAPVADPAGIEVNGAAFGVDGKTTVAVTLTRHDSLADGGESTRLTFRAWRLGNTGNTILAPDANLRFTTDGAGVSAVEELSAPGRRILRFAPADSADQVIGTSLFATVLARPAVGRGAEVELQMAFVRAISEGLVFPSRSARALIVDGYSGLLATVSSAPEYEVFDVAAFSNDSPVSVNVVSDSEFALYLESAPSQGASFPVRTTMSARCANGECAEIVAAEYNVEVVIVRAPAQTSRRANSDGDLFDSGALNIPAEVPESNLNFQEAAGTDPDNEFTVDPNTGAVRSNRALPAGGYTVTVIYTAAPALLGTLTTELQIESAATDSPGLFGDQDIIDDIEVKADDHELEADSDLRASYGGTRRGLDFVVVQPVGGDSGGDDDPMRANLELPGGSGLAAIRNFCTSRGVGWRLPTPQEAAGLANLNNSGEVGFYFEYESIKSDPVTGKSGEVLRSDLQAPGMEGRLVSIDVNTNRHVPPMRFSSLPNGLDSDSRLVFPNVLADHVVISAGEPIFASFQYDHVGTFAEARARYEAAVKAPNAPDSGGLGYGPVMLDALSNSALEADLRAEILSAHPNVDIAPTTLQAGLAQPAITGKYSAGEIAAAQAETENAAIHHHWELWLRQDTYFFEQDGNPHQVNHRRRLRVVGSPIGRQLVCVRPTGQGYSTGALPAALTPGGTVTLIRPAHAGLGGDFGTLTLNASRFDDQGNGVMALDAVPQLRSLNPNILARVVRSSPGFAEVALRPETAAAEFTGFLRGEALLEFSNSHSERIVVLLGVPNPPDPARPDAGPAPAVDECLAVPSPCVPNSQCTDTNTAAVGGVLCGACNPGYEANDNGECVSPVVRPVVPEGINVQGPVLPRIGLDTARAACVQLGGDYLETSEARRDSYASLEDLPYELRGWLAGGREYLRRRFSVSGGNSKANELDALALYWINSDNPNLTLIARSIGYGEEAEFNLRDDFLHAAYGPTHGDGWWDIFVDQGTRWAVAVRDLNNLTAGPFQVPSCLNLESENPGSVADLTDEEGLDLLDQARDCALQGKRLAEDGRCEEEACGEGEVLRGGRCQAETAPEPLPEQVTVSGNPVPDPEDEEQQSDVCTALGGTWTNDDKCVGLEADDPDGEADPTTPEGVTVFIQARDCALQGRRLNSNGECEEQTCPDGQVLQYGRCVSDNPPPPLPEGLPVTGSITIDPPERSCVENGGFWQGGECKVAAVAHHTDLDSERACHGAGYSWGDWCVKGAELLSASTSNACEGSGGKWLSPACVNIPIPQVGVLCVKFGGQWNNESNTCSGLAAEVEPNPFTCNSAETCADAFNLARNCALQGRRVGLLVTGWRCFQDELCSPGTVIRDGECQLVQPPPIPDPEDILPPPVLPDGTANPALFSLFNPEDEQKCIDAGGEIWEMTQDDTGVRGRLCVGYPPDRQSQSVCSSLESPVALQNPNSRFRDQFGSTFPLRIGGRNWESFSDLSSCHDGAYTCGDVREFEPDSVPTVNHDNNPLTPCLEIREPMTCEDDGVPSHIRRFINLLALQGNSWTTPSDRAAFFDIIEAIHIKLNGGSGYAAIIADYAPGGSKYANGIWRKVHVLEANTAYLDGGILHENTPDGQNSQDLAYVFFHGNDDELTKIFNTIPVNKGNELATLGDFEPPVEGENKFEKIARERRNERRHELGTRDCSAPEPFELPRVNRGGPPQIGFVSSQRLFNVRDVRPLSIVPVVTISAQIRQLESAAIETGDSLDDYAEEWEVERHDTIIEYLGGDWSGAATPHAFEVRPLAGAPTALQDWEIVTRPPEIVEGGAQSRALYLDQLGGDNTRMHPVTEVELADGSVSLVANLSNYWHFLRNQNGPGKVQAEHRAREAQAGCVPGVGGRVSI